jgi:hypothetical protein
MGQQARSGRLRISAPAAIVLLALAGICAAWLIGALGSGWLAGFLRHRLTLYAGGMLLGSAAALCLLVGVVWRLGRDERSRRTRTGQSGTAAIEFALVFPFALIIALLMIQSVLAVSGNLAVHYAAYAAARSAVVWVPEKLWAEEPRNVVADPGASRKLPHIRAAAVFALVPVSAGKTGVGGAGGGNPATITGGMATFFQTRGSSVPNWVRTTLAAKLHYAWDYTEVTLFPPANRVQYGDHEELKVSVRHMLYLSVPYVNRFFGDPLPGGGGDYGRPVEAAYALTNQGVEDDIDIEQFPRPAGPGD